MGIAAINSTTSGALSLTTPPGRLGNLPKPARTFARTVTRVELDGWPHHRDAARCNIHKAAPGFDRHLGIGLQYNLFTHLDVDFLSDFNQQRLAQLLVLRASPLVNE